MLKQYYPFPQKNSVINFKVKISSVVFISSFGQLEVAILDFSLFTYCCQGVCFLVGREESTTMSFQVVKTIVSSG